MRFDALTDFRILGADGDNAVGRDTDEGEAAKSGFGPAPGPCAKDAAMERP